MSRFILILLCSPLLVFAADVPVGGQINYGEYFFNTDPGFGNGTEITIDTPGTFNDTLNIDTAGLPVGGHVLYVRFQDELGNWSTIRRHHFMVLPTFKVDGVAWATTADDGENEEVATSGMNLLGSPVPEGTVPASAQAPGDAEAGVSYSLETTLILDGAAAGSSRTQDLRLRALRPSRWLNWWDKHGR